MAVFFLVLALLIAVLAVVFALQNADVISVVFFTSDIEGSLALILLVTFVVGVLTGVFLLLPYLVRHSLRNRRLKKELAESYKPVEDEEDILGTEDEDDE